MTGTTGPERGCGSDSWEVGGGQNRRQAMAPQQVFRKRKGRGNGESNTGKSREEGTGRTEDGRDPET